MQIDLKALNDNKSSIGTKVEIFAGGFIRNGKSPGLQVIWAERPGIAGGAWQGKGDGCGAAAVANWRAAGRSEPGSRENAGDWRT